ncbi:MAG: hypothetical protein KHW60_04055 [Oscillibacter sp.]|jgi:hypothetical protein|nr:hypothetical protein [Oscillibacter sp.]
MEVMIIFLVVFAGGFGWVLLDEYRRQKYGLSFNERFKQTMANLDRGVRRDIDDGVVRLQQEGKRMEV